MHFHVHITKSHIILFSWHIHPLKIITKPTSSYLSVRVVIQLHPTLWDPMDCCPPGSSVHGIAQAKILEWAVIPFSRGYFQPRDWTLGSRIAGKCLTIWGTGEALVTSYSPSIITLFKLYPLFWENSIEMGRPRGIRWRGRWEGGSGWGIHVNPWLIHVSVWQKPLQYCKVISLQLIKINGKKIHLKK